jgi:hypothetical protein
LPISDANQDIKLWQVCKWISTLGVAVKNKETAHEKKNIAMIFKSKKKSIQKGQDFTSSKTDVMSSFVFCSIKG